MNEELFLEIFEKVKTEENCVSVLKELILKLALRGKLSLQSSNNRDVTKLLIEIDKTRTSMKKKDRFDYSLLSKEEKWPFEIPKHWEWAHLGRICDFGTGKTPPRAETKYWQDGEINWVSISDINHGSKILQTKEKVTTSAKAEVFKEEPLPVHTIIMSFKLTIGKICRLGIPAYTNEAIIWLKPYNLNLENFLFISLPLMAQLGDTKAAVKGATLNRDSISRIKIPLPPLEEQKEIVDIVDTLVSLCNQLETNLEKEKIIKSDLLKALLA